jgi:hypothetical protein
VRNDSKRHIDAFAIDFRPDTEHLIHPVIPLFRGQPQRTDDAPVSMLYRLEKFGKPKPFGNTDGLAGENKQVNIAMGIVITAGLRTVEYDPVDVKMRWQHLGRLKHRCSVCRLQR